jgi:pimeloyl-ACP methyl ester carboxylesterase
MTPEQPQGPTAQTYRTIEELVPPQWVEGTVLVNGIHHHYYRTGGAKLPLVLLHGIQESGLCWLRVARALEADYDVVLLDARGHGRSDGVANGFTPELLTADVAGVIGALALERPSLLGHSMGADTAARVAAAYPELARAMLLEDPGWHDTPRAQIASSPGYQAWLASWIAWLEQLRALPPAERLAFARTHLPPGGDAWTAEEYVPWVEACAQLDLELVRLGPSLWASEGTDWRALVPRIACPILLMTGDPHLAGGISAVLTPHDAEQIAALWQRGQVVRFEGVGHLIHHGMPPESFDRFIAVVRDFLHEADAAAP